MDMKYWKNALTDIIHCGITESAVLGRGVKTSIEFRSQNQNKYKDYEIWASLVVEKGADYILAHAQHMMDNIGDKIVASLGKENLKLSSSAPARGCSKVKSQGLNSERKGAELTL